MDINDALRFMEDYNKTLHMYKMDGDINNEHLLSVDYKKTLEVLGNNHSDFVTKYKVSPFHIAFGILPSEAPLDDFELARQEFLAKNPFPKFPVIVPLTERSTLRDIKSLLLTFGFDKDKVQSLPDDLSIMHYKYGMLPSWLDDDIIGLISEGKSHTGHQQNTFYRDQNEDVKKRFEESLRAVTISKSNWPHFLVNQFLMHPMHLRPRLVEGSQERPMSKEFEFKIKYLNYNRAIMQHLVGDIMSRFEIQKQTMNSFSVKDVYAPMVHLMNCSGSGKTRAAFELGKLTNVLYVKFGVSTGTEESVVGLRIVNFFKSLAAQHRLDVSKYMDHIIQTILGMCGALYEKRPDTFKGMIIVDSAVKEYIDMMIFEGNEVGKRLEGKSFEEQLDDLLFSEFRIMKKYCLDSCRKFDNGKITSFLPLSHLAEKNKSWLLKRAADLKNNLNQSVRTKLANLPPLLIVLDEAHALMRENCQFEVLRNGVNVTIDFYQLIRGTLRFF